MTYHVISLLTSASGHSFSTCWPTTTVKSRVSTWSTMHSATMQSGPSLKPAYCAQTQSSKSSTARCPLRKATFRTLAQDSPSHKLQPSQKRQKVPWRNRVAEVEQISRLLSVGSQQIRRSVCDTCRLANMRRNYWSLTRVK